MGIIQELVANTQGVVREAVVRLPSRRMVRRPVNLLVPLELDDDTQQGQEIRTETCGTNMSNKGDEGEGTPQRRYNLRQRKPIDYNDDTSLHFGNLFLLSISWLSIVLFLLGCMVSTATAQEKPSGSGPKRSIHCFQGGVTLESDDGIPYEVCGDQFCTMVDAPNKAETVTFPPEVVVHEHRVQWKFVQNQAIATIETTCPAAPFCEAVRCTFCSANILNPECWLVSAIFGLVAILYFIITGCYVFLYVPLVVGQPFRVLAAISWMTLRGMVRFIKGQLRGVTRRRNRRRRLAEIIAVLATILGVSQECQLFNAFDHISTTCTEGSAGPCQVQLSEVFKINTFKQEACIRLSYNTTLAHEIRLTWKSLDLLCEPVTDLFTRDTVHRVVDSKRCAHRGSCVNEKCGAVNSSSLLPELEKGNKFPGKTACVESCGGLGCDCLSLSSGCLFYRIYLEPINDIIYEMFHCARWRESAKIRISYFDSSEKRASTLTTSLIPNVPKRWKSLSFTLTSLTLPPLFLLNTAFIMDERRTAIWNTDAKPALQCQTYAQAQNLTCSVEERCLCRPAETIANCECKEIPIGKWFDNIRNQLPLTFPSLSFHRYGKSVLARVTNMVTSEIVVNFKGTYEPTVLVDDAVCKIKDNELTGCYNCVKGALAQVLCLSSKDGLRAEIVCGAVGFSIPCNTTGITSTLRFSFSKAGISLECSVSCGKLSSTFMLEGMLKFTGSVTGVIEQWLQGTPLSASTVAWPDFAHIGMVILQWYKTFAVSIIGLIIILGITYLVLSTWGLKIAVWVLLIGPKVVIACIKATAHILDQVTITIKKRHSKQH